LGSEQFVQFCQGVSKTHSPWFPTSRHLFPIINGRKAALTGLDPRKRDLELNRPIP
jgi:hypothetical protein